MQHWEVRENLLTLVTDDGAASVPPAGLVYDALGFGANRPEGVPNPADNLPDLRFSRRGARLTFCVRADSDGPYLLEPHVTRLGRPLDCTNLPVPIPEHFVCGDSWTYFNEGCDVANEALEDIGVSAFGPITLSQYCRLIGLSGVGLAPHIDGTPLYETKDVPSILDEHVPLTLNAKLYPYQEVGYKWLSYMTRQTSGCILGDEMGLGKTLQVIALLLARHEAGHGTSLVIVPVSLMENWRRELGRFAPSLDVCVHHGPKRAGNYRALLAHDVVVLSYGSAVSDLGMLSMGAWDVVVLEEAQNVKNPDSQRSATVKAIPRRFGLAVSGTPFENHILDVWAVMSFSEPSLLGERSSFTRTYPDDLEGAVLLERVMTTSIRVEY